jgi:hypothetical protein
MADYDSLHSLLDYECLLFHCDWLGSDLRIRHFFSSVVRWLVLHSWTLNFWILLMTESLNSLTNPNVNVNSPELN